MICGEQIKIALILIRTEDGCKKMRESLVSFPIIIVVSTFVTIYVQYSIFAIYQLRSFFPVLSACSRIPVGTRGGGVYT